jgi:hypothetical protein
MLENLTAGRQLDLFYFLPVHGAESHHGDAAPGSQNCAAAAQIDEFI